MSYTLALAAKVAVFAFAVLLTLIVTLLRLRRRIAEAELQGVFVRASISLGLAVTLMAAVVLLYHEAADLWPTRLHSAGGVTLLGVSLFTYLAYEGIFQSVTMFHHSNIRLPVTVEEWLNKVIVTPRMHGIHHSTVKEETNSNFSVVFRWWDLLRGTLRLNVKQSEIVIGVPAYLEDGDNKFLNLLVMPFRKQGEAQLALAERKAPRPGPAGEP